MAQTYTLDEAAQRLGLSADDFKKRLRDEWKSVRSFRDGATLRFRAADIDELARSLGQASDPGLPLGSAGPLADSSEELSLEPPKSKPRPASSGRLTPPGSKPPGSKPSLQPLADDSDDIFSLPASGGPKSKPKAGGKGDSDVRLDATPKRSDVGGNQPTEEIELDLPPASGVGLGKSSAKLTAPKSSARNKIPGASDAGGDDGSSEFELSLDSDSDSFELQLTSDSSEESALGGDLPATGGAQSGINLGRPADSGVNLEKKGAKPPVAPEDSDGDFELSLDPPAGNGGPKSRPIPAAKPEEGSSEFELTLDDSDSESMNQLAADVQSGQAGDIFETDFELPVMGEDESGSEVLQVDAADTDLENSDFDLAIDPADAPADDESASQVVLMDDEPLVAEDAVALEDDVAVVDEEDDVATALARDERRGPVRTEVVEKVVAPPPPKWGIVPILALAPTFLIVVLGGLMAYEVVRSMAGYQQPTASPIVRGVAGTFGLKSGD